MAGVLLVEAAASELAVTTIDVLHPHRSEGATRDPLETLEEAATNPTTRRSNHTAGPGSACRLRSDCASFLICLRSGRCGCPERFPVLTRREGSFACSAPRRLNEHCLSHAECKHGNENARCLLSVCSCPPHFYAARASLLCLPESVAWRPVRAAVVPAALLLLIPAAFLLFTAIAYYRSLHSSSSRRKERTPRNYPTEDDSGDLRYERFRKCFEGRSSQKIYRASTTFCFSSDRLRIGVPCTGLGRTAVISELVRSESDASNSLSESFGFTFEVGRTRPFPRRVRFIKAGPRDGGTSSGHGMTAAIPEPHSNASLRSSKGTQECDTLSTVRTGSSTSRLMSKTCTLASKTPNSQFCNPTAGLLKSQRTGQKTTSSLAQHPRTHSSSKPRPGRSARLETPPVPQSASYAGQPKAVGLSPVMPRQDDTFLIAKTPHKNTKPIPKPRTKLFICTEIDLEQCSDRSQRMNPNSPLVLSARTPFPVPTLPGDSGDVLSKLRRTVSDDRREPFQRRHLHCTETELRCKPCKKSKSQELRIRIHERLRRTVSCDHDYSSAFARNISRSYEFSGTPSRESWCQTEISHDLHADLSDKECQHAADTDICPRSSKSACPSERVAWKQLDPITRMCSTVSRYSESWRNSRKTPMEEGVEVAVVHATSWLSKLRFGPRRKDALRRWRERSNSVTAPSRTRTLSQTFAMHTEAFASRGARSGSDGPACQGKSLSARSCRSAPQVFRVDRLPLFIRASQQSLDSALAAAALRAERGGSGSSFYSFPFTRSDCSNLPLSLSARLRSEPVRSLQDPSTAICEDLCDNIHL